MLNIKHGENQISFSLQNAAGSTGIPDGSVITYSAVRPAVDLKYVMSSGGVKEMLVLNERPASNADLTFRFVLNANGLEPKTTKRGGIDLVDEKGKIQFSIPAAVAWDSASPGIPLVNPEAAKLALIRSGDQWFVDLKADSKWLSAAEREYPVFLDPEVYIASVWGNVGDDGYISDAYPFESYGSRWNGTFWTNLFGYFLPGQGDSRTGYQTYAKYDVSPYNNQKITSAYWYSYVTDAAPNPANYRMKPVNAPDWASNTIN